MKSTNDEAPTVSVVTPVYNGEKYLKEMIASVKHQTYGSWEHILINDGSSDNSKDVMLAELEGSNYVYIENETNKGISASRNAGIKKARGKYIAFIDQDDVWHAEKLEKQVRFFEDYPGNLGALGTSVYHINDSGEIIAKRKPYNPEGDVKDRLSQMYLKNPLITTTVLVPRKLFDEVGLLNEDRFGCDDIECWINIGAKYEIRNVMEPLAYRRYHSDNASLNPKMILHRIELTKEIARNHPELKPYRNRQLSKQYYALALMRLRSGSREGNAKLLFKSWVCNFSNLKALVVFALVSLGRPGRAVLKKLMRS